MKVGIFNMSKFVKVAIDHSEGMAICESALFDVYCVESPEETITLEDFKQKVKDTASKVWAKILSWFKKVKEFFKNEKRPRRVSLRESEDKMKKIDC